MSDTGSAAAAKDYKDTVNLPKTDFPMKGNLGQLEPRMLQWWAEQGTYAALLEKNAKAPLFTLHDGPPYANGHLHAGHALNKILKDIVTKYRNMSGRLCDFIPGWDTHGLPIEQAVEKRLKDKKIDKRTLPREEFLALCRAYALEFIDIQREEFKRMGVMGSWDKPYRTLDFAFEAQEIRELATFAKRGMLYRRKKPVYWCLTDQTALAEAEVEYEDHTSPSVYVAFPALPEANKKLSELVPALQGAPVSFVIWTTTPWTLPANLAIAANATFEYVLYRLNGRVVLVAKDLLAKFLSDVKADEMAVRHVELPGGEVSAAALAHPEHVVGYVQGDALEGLTYQHPFIARTGKLLLGEHVTLEAGTGLVHTAPGHGQEDYELGLKYGLDIYNPLKSDGRYDETAPDFLVGKKVFEANPLVIDVLVEKGALLNDKGDKVRHSYPHCWRCRNPVILSATYQWFIPMDQDGFRQKVLAEVDRVKWVPEWGHSRIRGMLEGRPDWCISRQRTWGVPIPIAHCEGCDDSIVSAEVMERVAARVEKEGAGAWYSTPVEEFLGAGFKCPKCAGTKFRRETDILDVWFDSACTFAAVAAQRPTLRVPCDLYLEGSDQHRGWFHSSMLVGVGTRDRSPYETCLTHGFVVDGAGEKMSKSRGNVVLPEKIISQYGAEVMRLWVAASDYRDDVRLSDQILKGLSEGYRKIRNTLRYALGNLDGFDPAKHAVPDAQLLPLDRWALARLGEVAARVRDAYEAYAFHLVYQTVVDFCAGDLSAVYFDILKDRLYTAKADGPARRSAQTAVYRITETLLQLLAPVMSFTAEEAWQFLPGKSAPSVFLAGFPQGKAGADAELTERYRKLFAVRSAVQGLLEVERREKRIGSSTEARVVLSATGEAKAFLQQHLAELPGLFIVSQVELADAAGEKAQALDLARALPKGEVKAEVLPARGEKCPRCWTYSEAVGQGGDLCLKCREALG